LAQHNPHGLSSLRQEVFVAHYHFITACRNEAGIIETFFEEFDAAVADLSSEHQVTLHIIDDCSLDNTVEVIRSHQGMLSHATLDLIELPVNLGNQGALFFGIRNIQVGPDDVLLSFDCDGEDDIGQIPSIVKMGEENPGKAVFIERRRRAEGIVFQVCFSIYKLMFRYLSGKNVIPNNFMLLPGRFVDAVKGSALVSAHFAYGVMRLGIPHVITRRDRRTRYGGQTSQNLYALISHGMVGIMVFFETVLGRLFLLASGMAFAGFAFLLAGTAGEMWPRQIRQVLLGLGLATGFLGAVMLGLMLAASLALMFKVMNYWLTAPEGRPKTPQEPT
jgi:hypothetical protein